VTHEDTFFESSLREALTGETPPDVLSRVLAQARAEGVKPRELQSTTSGRSAAGNATTRRWVVARVLGALCLSILAGGAFAFASSWFAPVTDFNDSHTALDNATATLNRVEKRVSEIESNEARRTRELEALESEVARLEYSLATPEEKVERALVENERKRRERMEQAEELRRERHVAWAQEVRKKERTAILNGLVANVDLTAEQKTKAEKVLEDWGNSVVGAIRGHYPEDRRREGRRGEGRGRGPGPQERHLPDARETMDSVTKLNHSTIDALRGLLEGRQQLAFDSWMAKGGGGALAQGADPWLPPAVDLDDLNNFDEWRR
jgi:hypothetical protein